MEIPDWAAAYEEHHAGIRAYLYRRLSDPELADDLASEVFTKAMNDYAKGHGARRHFKGWLYKIAHNLIIDTYRKRTRTGLPSDLDALEHISASGLTAIELADSRIAGEHIERAIQRLTQGQRVAIWANFHGYSAAEIATMLGVGEGAAKALLHRGRVALRFMLRDYRRGDNETESDG